jgi:hypothetical protein
VSLTMRLSKTRDQRQTPHQLLIASDNSFAPLLLQHWGGKGYLLENHIRR